MPSTSTIAPNPLINPAAYEAPPKKDRVRIGALTRISSDPNDKRAGVTNQREDVTVLCEVIRRRDRGLVRGQRRVARRTARSGPTGHGCWATSSRAGSTASPRGTRIASGA